MSHRARYVLAIVAVLAIATPTLAADGTWNVDADGDWSTPGNWVADVADGADATADITTVNIGDNRTITLDSARTIGHLTLADAGTGDGSNTRGWTITDGGNAANILTLDTDGAGTPSIATGAGSSNAGNVMVFDVSIAGDEGVDIIPLGAPFDGAVRPIYFAGDNTYSGVTTVKTDAWLRLSHDNALGASSAVVESGGVLELHSSDSVTDNRVISSTVHLESGAELANDTANTAVSTFSGDLTIAGSVVISTDGHRGTLVIDTEIAETAGGSTVEFGATQFDSNRGTIVVKQASSYTGDTTLTRSSRVEIEHADAFGTTATTIDVNGTGSGNNRAQLTVTTSAGGLNANKTVELGEFGIFTFGRGVVMDNTINSEGGLVNFASGTGSSTYDGNLTLAAGTETTILRSSVSGMDWFQDGIISGSGGLVITGTNNNDNDIFLRGDNTYSGGTRLTMGGREERTKVASDTAFGAGTVNLEGNAVTDTMMTLVDDVSMANTFSGLGHIATGNFTFTLADGGILSPGSSVGELSIEDLVVEGGYLWEYDGTDSDVVHTETLAFSGSPQVGVLYVGGGSPAIGDFLAFTYNGDDPDVSGVEVLAPEGLAGVLTVDTDLNEVYVSLAPVPEPATLALLGIGGLMTAGAAARRRRGR